MKGPTENYDSPLDGAFENLPEEEPPNDLKERCMNALEESGNAPARWRRLPWGRVLRNVAAAAAVFMVVVAAGPALRLARGPAEPESTGMSYPEGDLAQIAERPPSAPEAPEPRPVAEEALDRTVAGPPAEAPSDAGGGRGDTVIWGGPEAGVGAATNNPSLFRSRRAEDEETKPAAGDAFGGPDRAVGAVYQRRPESAPPAEMEVTQLAEDATMRAGVRISSERVATTVPRYSDTNAAAVDTSRPGPVQTPASRAATVAEPWRDESGERKVISQKDLELAVSRVESAYDDARAIITKHGGYVASDSLQIGIDGDNRVQLVARVPHHEFNDTVSEIQRLGKVVRMVGTSTDMTYEYYTKGSEVREMADKEQALIEKLAQEKNAARQHQIRQELNRLRQQMHGKKSFLEQLSEQVHWPVLQVTLVEKAGPGQFLGQTWDNVTLIGAWLAATAIFWVPALVIVAVLWRRVKPGDLG